MNQAEKRVAFVVSAMAFNDTTYDTQSESLNLATTISDEAVTKTCAGYVTKKECMLYSSIGEYDGKPRERIAC